MKNQSLRKVHPYAYFGNLLRHLTRDRYSDWLKLLLTTVFESIKFLDIEKHRLFFA